MLRLFCSAATHKTVIYVFLMELRVEAMYSYILIPEQVVMYTLDRVVLMKYQLQYSM